ncbi:uncharacterized protein LOC128306360 [Anopheles moucheti]|uniref:uncharacterized protein LOC128306360 n=1 Tax=Anopheles moucheti TaxID=186751 RepID=UPI0022F01B64|nr:uncharacterized protein LOC128306360 [Anopheles moucheti]
MSRRKQAKPRALKHEGDEETAGEGMASAVLQNNGTGKSAPADVKSDSMLEDITDDDDDGDVEGEGDEQDLEESSDDEPELEVKQTAATEGIPYGKEVKSGMCELEVSPCEETSRADPAVIRTAEVTTDELNAKSNHIVKHCPATTECADERKDVESDQNKLPIDSTSVRLGGDRAERPLEMDGVEDKNDDDNEEIDDEVDDNDDDEEDDDDEIDDDLLEDDEDEEGDHVRLDDGDGGQDVDDEFTSDSFCSELYSSHTSSSFSPSISDGMTTPNSITNDAPDGALLALGTADEKPFRQQGNNHPAHHIHPRHQHHVHHRRTAGGHASSAKEGGKASLKHHHQLNNNNNSSSHNHNNNNNNGSNSKGLNSTYHCQFCEKTFPRLGYLKKHEQSHTEHMPFKCEYCARLFKHKRSRDRHTKLHTGDRRYRCLHCEAAFSRSDHLKIHMKTHDNQKPFQCTICNRGYNTAAALTSHMQNHKKQLALTGSPNLTYSPRSTTSSLSSGGGGSGGGKRGAKFSPYANDPLLLMSRGSAKLSSTLAKASAGNISSNRTPTPGSTGAGSTSGGPASGSAHADLLSCPYCTRTDFSTLEQLGLHVQSMHGHGALGLLGAADSPMPYFAQGNRRAVTPDGNSLSLGGLGPYPPITCEFCTMKFPTVPLMFAHLKTSHLDRLAGGPGLQRSSPNGTTGSPLGGSRPPSGFHPLEQLHFNKNLLGNAFPALYAGMGAGSSTNISSMSGGSIKMEHRTTASANGRDENGNEQSELGRKRKRKGHDADREDNHGGSSRKKETQQEDIEADGNNDGEDGADGDNEHFEERNEDNVNRDSPVDMKEPLNSHDAEAANIKQESKDDTDPTMPEAASPSTSTRSSPCDSLGSIVHPNSHPPSGRNSPAEQLTPTDLSQPKMKRLKLETLLEDEEEVPEPDKKLMVTAGRSHSREHHKQRRREGEPKEPHPSAQHQHNAVSQLHSSAGGGANVPPPSQSAASSSAAHLVHQLPGAYLCNQCNAALPDFESFRTHLKAHLEQSAASAAAAAAMRLTGEHTTGPGGTNTSGTTPGTSGGSLSLTTFLCQQCGATLSCQAEYEQHTIGHFLVMAVEYRCQAAGGGATAGSSCTGKTSFGKVEDLHKHLYESHMQLLYKCTVCGETFESKVQVQVHFAVSHSVEVKLYRCSACAEVFRSERDFRQHIRNRHLTAGAVQCMFCRMVCSSELEMHFHLASHARKFKCPACPESFHVEFLLDRHIQTQHSQKEADSPNRRESNALSTAPSTVPSATTNPSLTASTATGTAVSTTATSAVAGLDYLHLHGQMAAMAAAAAWPSLYQTANKFYSNTLQVDTLNQLKHPQHLLHGFYDTMLGKAHQQQQRSSFLPDPPTGSGTAIGGKKNPFAGHSPNTSATNALLGLGYGATSATSTGASQPQRTAGSHTLNGSSTTGLYSPEEGTNAGTNVTSGSSKLYSPIAMIQRYGDGGGLHSTGATASTGVRPGVESPTGQLLLASHTTLGLPDHHHNEQTGRKPNQQPSGKPSSALAASGTPQMASTGAGSCYSCGICERSDFSTESEVQTHRKIVHNLKTGVSLRCAYCNGDFRSRNELENHMKVAHNTGGGKHKCLICDEIFPSPAVLAEHKLSHCKVGASGRCSHCSLPLPDAHTFKQHLQAHQQSLGAPVTSGTSSNAATGGAGVQCTGSSSGGQNVGSSASSTGGNANANAGSSNAEQERFPQQCICCRQTLNSEFEISLHAKFHTKSPDTNERTCALCLEPLPSQPESSTKICDPCLKRHNFPSKLLSMNFLKPSASTSLGPAPTIAGPTHSLVGPSNAPIEGRTPASSGIQHEQQPTPGREGASSSSLYQCNLCKKPLPSSQKLQEHLIDHTFAGCEERGYVCYLCSAVFTSSAGLQAHLPVAHSNAAAKPYDCERCGAAYFFRAELEHHLIDHELGRTMRSAAGSFAQPSSARAGDDEWRSAPDSPMSEDDGLRESQNDHIKEELCEPEQDQAGSSPYRHKDDDSEDENEEPAGNEEDEGDDAVNAEPQIDEEVEEEDRMEDNDAGGQQMKQNAGEHVYQENDVLEDVVGAEESNDATDVGEQMEERDQQEQQEQEEDEEYIEVDEHTMTMDDGGGKATHNERLRRTSNMLLNGGKDCATLSATTTPTLPVVTAAE